MTHRYKVELDSDGYIVSIYVPADESEGEYELDLSTLDVDFLNCYKIIGGVFTLDEDKKQSIISAEQVIERIAELKQKLADTDYIQDGFINGLMGLNKPATFIVDLISLISSTMSDYSAIISQRAEWINELKQLTGGNK